MAQPWVAYAGRRRRIGHGHVAGGHAPTRVHVGARVGRHVAGRASRSRAHGLVGLGKRVGAVTRIILYLRSPYLTASSPNVFSVCDYVPTCFSFASGMATRLASDLSENHQSRGPESTRSSINARALYYV